MVNVLKQSTYFRYRLLSYILSKRYKPVVRYDNVLGYGIVQSKK